MAKREKRQKKRKDGPGDANSFKLVSPVPKISLNKEGTLLRCIRSTRLSAKKQNKTRYHNILRGDIVMYLGCWYYKQKLPIGILNLHHDLNRLEMFKKWWYGREHDVILHFLLGEKILRTHFLDQNLPSKKKRMRSLYQAAEWMYKHFQPAMAERK
jgi:hypothetical protein